tara:strand:- start:330 stop:539 length:210 start_codon:yes stop_codon:yes gene_type:complete
MENKEPITEDSINHYISSDGKYSYALTFIDKKKPTIIELIAKFFARLDERIQNMSEEEYQAYKRKMGYE